jgi:hypothetical protein
MSDIYDKQRRDRLSEVVGDYLTDESIPSEKFYNDLKKEVEDWVDYYKKYYDKSSKVLSYIQRESLISEATDKDWEDFWHHEDKEASDFTKVWREMDKVEPLTPVTRSQRKD